MLDYNVNMSKQNFAEHINNSAKRLRALAQEVAPLQRDILAAHHGEDPVPHYKDVNEVKQALDSLYQQRAESIHEDINARHSVGEDANARARWLLRYRADIVPEMNPDEAVADIQHQLHQAHDLVVVAHNFLKAAGAYDLQQQDDLRRQMEVRGRTILSDAQRTSHVLTELAQNGPMSPEEVKEWHDNAPGALPEASRQAFAENCYRLGEGYIKIGKAALNRINNAVQLVRLIDNGLIPYEPGDAEKWRQERKNLIQETADSIEKVRNDYLRCPGGYLKQAQKYMNPS